MSPEPTITLSGEAARDLVRVLAGGVTPEAMLRVLVEALPMEERRAAFKDIVHDIGTMTQEEAGALVHWTGAGFARRATQENCPAIKMGHEDSARVSRDGHSLGLGADARRSHHQLIATVQLPKNIRPTPSNPMSKPRSALLSSRQKKKKPRCTRPSLQASTLCASQALGR